MSKQNYSLVHEKEKEWLKANGFRPANANDGINFDFLYDEDEDICQFIKTFGSRASDNDAYIMLVVSEINDDNDTVWRAFSKHIHLVKNWYVDCGDSDLNYEAIEDCDGEGDTPARALKDMMSNFKRTKGLAQELKYLASIVDGNIATESANELDKKSNSIIQEEAEAEVEAEDVAEPVVVENEQCIKKKAGFDLGCGMFYLPVTICSDPNGSFEKDYEDGNGYAEGYAKATVRIDACEEGEVFEGEEIETGPEGCYMTLEVKLPAHCDGENAKICKTPDEQYHLEQEVEFDEDCFQYLVDQLESAENLKFVGYLTGLHEIDALDVFEGNGIVDRSSGEFKLSAIAIDAIAAAFQNESF